MARLSPERRRGSQELLAVEFCTADGGNVVGEFSPCKPSRAVRARAALMAAFEGTAGGPAAAGSPCAIADGPCAPSTASQPSSATSSLAAALADLQVASRQSSENDLGDRSKLLAALGLPGSGALCPPPGRQHSHSGSRSGEDDMLLAAVYLPTAVQQPRDDDAMCSSQLIGAVRSFDSQVLRRLTPIKTRSKTPPGGAAAPPSPAAPLADSLASPFQEQRGMKPKQLAPASGRPVIYHSRSSSITAPGAYNPYDLTAAALSSEFRSPAKSLHSPFPSSSRATSSATVTPIQWGSASYRSSSYRALAAQQALAAQKDDEPDFYVSVPGVRRQQSGLARGSSNLSSSTGSMGCGTATAAAAAAAAAASQAGPQGHAAAGQKEAQHPQAALERRPTAERQHALERQPTLGSGTAVHGFKGLFRNIIVGASTSGQSPPQGGRP